MNAAPASAQIEPAARLLLACISEPGPIEELAGQIGDWGAFVASAAESLAIPFVHRNLPRLDRFVPPAARLDIERAYRVSTARNLQLAALLVGLHERWFAPNAIRYAAVKGVCLAQRHYGGLAERSCRDLDLLVDPASCPATITYLAEAGFRPCQGFELPDDRSEWDRHIEAMCDLNREISLRSPAGDLLDVHRALDLTGADFPTDQLLTRVEPVAIFGKPIPGLSAADQFAYLCYHHSRHNWTRLHWVADIGQLVAAPDFDRATVLSVARQAGMERLVEACIEMCGLLSAASRGEEPPGRGLAATMARQCLAYLQPGAEAPLLTYHRRHDDSAFRWRHWFGLTAEEWRYRRGFVRKLRTLLRSSMPSWESYRALPLPRRRRWLYLPLRTGTHLIRYTPLRRLLGRKGNPNTAIEPVGNQAPSDSTIAAETLG